MSRSFRMPAAVLASGLALVALAGPADAHVSVHADDAAKGAYTVLDFRVPNETDSAYTTKVAVTFTSPLASAAPQVVEGWTATVTKAKLATPITTDDGTVTDGVGSITWTATGKGTAPGFFQTFQVEAGPLPATDTVAFPTVQTYGDGSVVRWTDATVPGGAEPEHPAPTLSLTAAVADASGGTGPSVSTVVTKEQSKGLGIAALVVGAVGVLLGGAALARRPKA